MLWHRSIGDAQFAPRLKELQQLPPWLGLQRNEAQPTSQYLCALIPSESGRGPLAASMNRLRIDLPVQNPHPVFEAYHHVFATFFAERLRREFVAWLLPPRQRSDLDRSSFDLPIRRQDEDRLHAPRLLVAAFNLDVREQALRKQVSEALRKPTATTTYSPVDLLVEYQITVV